VKALGALLACVISFDFTGSTWLRLPMRWTRINGSGGFPGRPTWRFEHRRLNAPSHGDSRMRRLHTGVQQHLEAHVTWRHFRVASFVLQGRAPIHARLSRALSLKHALREEPSSTVHSSGVDNVSGLVWDREVTEPPLRATLHRSEGSSRQDFRLGFLSRAPPSTFPTGHAESGSGEAFFPVAESTPLVPFALWPCDEIFVHLHNAHEAGECSRTWSCRLFFIPASSDTISRNATAIKSGVPG
jgi:hypothetical protein